MRLSAVILLVVVLGAPSCRFSDLQFQQDNRLTFTTPEPRSDVELPLMIRWNIEGFEVTGPTGESDSEAGYFGVFVDQIPMPPKKTVDWFAREDVSCRGTPGCPDDEYLAARGVFITAQEQLKVETLESQFLEGEQRELHQVAVVLLDGTGRRIGETSWDLEFFYERGG